LARLGLVVTGQRVEAGATVLACRDDRCRISNGPTGAINGRLEHL
jgi:hypothetical protein